MTRQYLVQSNRGNSGNRTNKNEWHMSEPVIVCYDRWLLGLSSSGAVSGAQIQHRPLCLFPLDLSSQAFAATCFTDGSLSDELLQTHFGAALNICLWYSHRESAATGAHHIVEQTLSVINFQEPTIEDLQTLLCCCAVAPLSLLHHARFEAVPASLLRILDQPANSLV